MERAVPNLRGTRAAAVLALAALFQFLPVPASAGDPFHGYPAAVREQAERVVAAAAPDRLDLLAREVRELRKRMHAQGILSLDPLPDLVVERALREGWAPQVEGCIRKVMDASPLCIRGWAWLVKEDLRTLRIADLGLDIRSLSAVAEVSAPARAGMLAWGAALLSTAACWFVVWAAIALFLRARPAVEADIARIVGSPYRDYAAAPAAVLLFLSPLLLGLGPAVAACLWLVLSAGYLRRGELALMTGTILLLAAIVAGWGAIRHLEEIGGGSGRGGWLGVEGAIPGTWPGVDGRGAAGADPAPWLVKYARARAEMSGGRPAEAERIWTELAREGRALPAVLNNRGIARARQGRTVEALADFEAALDKRPADGAALWNAYQVHLRLLNLERAQEIQSRAWDELSKMTAFRFRPGEMEPGEWIASPLPAKEAWNALLRPEASWFGKGARSAAFLHFFRPLKASAALAFLGLVLAAAWLWKILSMRFWVHVTCRGCGANALASGSAAEQETCNACRSQTGAGLRPGEEQELRALEIVQHRRAVRVASILVPGSGALWSGKPVRASIFGILLSLALAGASAFAGRVEGSVLVADVGKTLWALAIPVAAALWLAGAAWGDRSFLRFQERYNLVRTRG